MPLAKCLNKTGHYLPVVVYEVPFVAADFADDAVVDTGYDLPDEGEVEDVVLLVDAEEATAATKTLSVGLINAVESGDEDGFLVAASVAAAGRVLGSLANGANTRGAYLKEVSGEAGEHTQKGYVLNGTAKSVALTFGDAAGATELAGRVLFYIRHDPATWKQVA